MRNRAFTITKKIVACWPITKVRMGKVVLMADRGAGTAVVVWAFGPPYSGLFGPADPLTFC